MAAPSVTYTFSNGTTADASEVNQNFSDIISGITDGTEDLTISALTCQGTITANSTINKVTITPPTTSATITVADGKTFTCSNTLTFSGTDSSSVAFGAGGTVTYTSNTLAVFAATTSSQLAGVISDETGSGALVFGTSPTIATPSITGTITVSSTPRISGTLDFDDGLTINQGSTLSTYTSTSVTTNTQSSAFAATSATVYLHRVGDVVTCIIPEVRASVTSADTLRFSANHVPAGYRPTTLQHFLVFGEDNGTATATRGYITTGGVIIIQGSITSGSFTTAASGGVYRQAVKWDIN